MEVTKAPLKYLPDSGVVFEGVENIKIQSREEVRKKLEEYLETVKKESTTTIRFVLAEWGEGKTDIYKRYLEPNAEKFNFLPIFVSTSTIVASFDSFREFINSTPLPSLQFLASLFVSAKEEKQLELPVAKDIDPRNYIEECIRLLSENGARKLVIFIDEFEETISYPDKLKKIISGLKETINGQFDLIHKGGKFEGILHLIIAVTPDAFYKIEVNAEFSQIFGGLGRRIGVIYLPGIKRIEGVHFLWNLIKGFCFNDELPEKLPISSVGVLNVIYRITLGNLGNMVSKLSRIISRSLSDGRKIHPGSEIMRVIDYELTLDFFANEIIAVYGGSTKCIDAEFYRNILKIVSDQKDSELGKDCEVVLKLLVGEYKPFSQEEIVKRAKIKKNIQTIIDTINNDIKNRFGIQKGILCVSKVKENTTKEDLRKIMGDFITKEGEEEYIKIDNYSEKFEEFLDRITFAEIDKSGEIHDEMYLPVDSDDIKEFFEGISEIRAKELRYKFKKLLREEFLFLVSDSLLNQIFPTPVPKGIEFIKDRELRMRSWREVTRNFSEQFKNSFPTAFLTALKLSDISLHSEKAVAWNSIFGVISWKTGVDISADISCLFYSVDGDVKAEDIEIIYNIFENSENPIHLVVLLYTGEITENAKEKIDAMEIGENGENFVLQIKLHPTLAKKLIIIQKSNEAHENKIDKDIMISCAKKIIIDDLNFHNKLDWWIKDQQNRGLVVLDPKLENAKSSGELVGALKFYINCMGEYLTLEEVYNKNKEEIIRFTKYGSKIGFISDIESIGKFERLSQDLMANNFLEYSEGKFTVKQNPVEKRIIKILNKKEGKTSYEDLKNHFIISAKTKNILKDLYLEILKHKGSIKEEKGMIILLSDEELKKEMQKIKKNVEEISRYKNYERYGLICVCKEREHRLILLNEFLNYISEKVMKIEHIESKNNDVRRQKIYLLSKMMDAFSDEWLEAIKKAFEYSEGKIKELNENLNTLKTDLQRLREYCCKYLKLNFDNLNEIIEVERLKNEIIKIKDEPPSNLKSKFSEELKKNNVREMFDFKKDPLTFPFFNVKVYIIDTYLNKAKNQIENTSNKIKTILYKFDEFEKDLENVGSKIKEFDIDKEFNISKSVLEYCKKTSECLFPILKEEKIENASIKYLEEIYTKNLESIKENIEGLNKLTSFLERIYKEEVEFHKELRKSSNYIQKAKILLNLDFMQNKINEIEIKFKEIEQNNLKLLQKVNFKRSPIEIIGEVDNILENLKSEKNKIKEIKEEINEIWQEYRIEVEKSLETLKELVKILEKKHTSLKNNLIIIFNDIDRLQQIIEPEELILLTRSAEEIEKTKTELGNKFYEIVKTVIQKEEVTILEIVVTNYIKFAEGKFKVVWKEEIYKGAKEKLGIEEEKVDKILSKLEKEGFIKTGITLSV